MRFYPATSTILALLSLLSLWTAPIAADRIFESSSLDNCQANSSFTASLFNIVFAPDNRTLAINVIGESSVTGNVTFKVYATAYGYQFLTETLNPCTLGLATFCPMSSIQTDFDTIYHNVSASVIGSIPSIAYQIPDLDAVVTVYMYANDNPTVSLACLRAHISNGKTVDQVGVRWATAIIAIVGLIASGVVSSLGFLNTATHMMIYTLSLWSYFQSVAIIGLCAVPLPPIVRAWTQDMSWSVGVINVKFLQKMARWYQIGTGGTPSTVITTLSTKSVQIAKRSLDTGLGLAARSLYPRAKAMTTSNGDYIVTGIVRLAFLENMEATNLFMTALSFYFIFVVFGAILVLLYKFACEFAIRMKWIGSESYLFNFIHNGWQVTFKGIVFRLILIGYPPMMIFSLWEFTQVDSPAEVFLAVIFFFGMTAALIYASFKVFRIAKRSEQIYKTAAYSLYADATILNKWGFLYVQYKASSYLYIVPMFVYVLLKAFFVGLAQKSGETQAIALVMIEAFALIGASVVRPWMDKTTNTINISICVINFLNAIMLLIFTDVFDGPGLLIGVLGIVFFFANVIFALVLLVIVLVVITFSFIKKDPETQYEAVADNRASFIKSQVTLNQELDALGASARGTGISEEKYHGIDHRMNSLNSNHSRQYSASIPYNDRSAIPSPAFAPGAYKDNDDLPSSRSSNVHERMGDPYRSSDSASARSNVESGYAPPGVIANSPGLRSHSPLRTNSPGFRTGSPASNSPSVNRSQNGMWQRGAGYT